MEFAKTTGLPLADGLTTAIDVPSTISLAVTYRTKINSLMELSDEHRPPRNLWDKPHRLSEFFDEVFNRKGQGKSTKFLEYNFDEVE